MLSKELFIVELTEHDVIVTLLDLTQGILALNESVVSEEEVVTLQSQ